MSRQLSLLVVCSLFVFASSEFLLAQTNPITNSTALALGARSLTALTRGSAITDVRLTANTVWIAGPEPEPGTGVLLAKGTAESRVDLSLNGGGKRTEIRNSVSGRTGKWINSDGTSGKYVFHNCLTDAVWFFPALSSLLKVSDSRFVFSYLGEETWNELPVDHLRIYQAGNSSKEAQRLSTMDFYLDPRSSLPLGVAFKIHPDRVMNAEILTEIRFADYRVVNGVEVPFRVQRVQNGALLLDITVTGASVNTNLSDQAFDTQ